MTEQDAALLELQLPGCRVMATAAVNPQEPGDSSEDAPSDTRQPAVCSEPQATASGGVMIILPTYLCTTNCTLHVLIPGYAIAVTIAHKSFQWCIISVYLRSGHERHLLDLLLKELRKLVNGQRIETFILAGDFNQARSLPTWENMLSEFDLLDQFGHPFTYVGPSGPSALDTCLAPASLFDINQWTCAKRVLPRRDGKYGHLPIRMRLLPPKSTKRQVRPRYFRLPDTLFKNTTPQCRNLPTLLTHFLDLRNSLVEEQLDNLHAFFHAFCATFPWKHDRCSESFVRMTKHKGKPRVSLPKKVLDNWTRKTSIALRVDDFSPTTDGHVSVPARVLNVLVRT